MILFNHHDSPFAALEWLERHPNTAKIYQRTSDGAIMLVVTPEIPEGQRHYHSIHGFTEQLDIADLRHFCSFHKEAQARFRESMAAHNEELAEREAIERQLEAERLARISSGKATQSDLLLQSYGMHQTFWK